MEVALGLFSGGGAGLSSLFGAAGGITGSQAGLSLTSMLAGLAGGSAAQAEGRAQRDIAGINAKMTREEADMAARGEHLNATQEYLSGASSAVKLREHLAQTIGGQRIAFAASGVEASSGSAARVTAATEAAGANDLELSRDLTRIAQLQREINASVIRRKGELDASAIEIGGDTAKRRGDAAMTSAVLSAAGTAFKTGVSMEKRG